MKPFVSHAVVSSSLLHCAAFGSLLAWSLFGPKWSQANFAGSQSPQQIALVAGYAEPDPPVEVEVLMPEHSPSSTTDSLEPASTSGSRQQLVHAAVGERQWEPPASSTATNNAQTLAKKATEAKPVVEVVKPTPRRSQQKNPNQVTQLASTGMQNRQRPDLSSNPAPSYPVDAYSRGIEGTVLLRLEIDRRGAIVSVLIEQSSGSRLLDEAAVSAVQAWTAVPAVQDGQPVPSTEYLPVWFHLR